MLAQNVTLADLHAVAAPLKLRIINYQVKSKTRCRFRLGTVDRDTWRAVSHTGRRKAAVCWHGHREFFRALFALVPEARIQTTFLVRQNPDARWYTAANFELTFRSTGAVNVGSMIAPMRMDAACKCCKADRNND